MYDSKTKQNMNYALDSCQRNILVKTSKDQSTISQYLPSSHFDPRDCDLQGKRATTNQKKTNQPTKGKKIINC